ncbi:ABC transporter permease [Brevibacterium spongiae]|uniref:ABC transporter permease n=1 Tax=Brevibacterium spongiae TaxID=2909672 RepID=A0ABY5SRK3_9MICO|nr:ABC transporter permease [Brevibacterium spongiae]UVI35746.1 ABC transporter permease [Brevibacterium spongiae]
MSPRYLASRLAQGLLVLWIAFTLSFFLLYWLPGDPVITMLGAGGELQSFDPAEVARLRAEFNLDQPLPIQYLLALFAVVRLDFGTSIQAGTPVTEAIAAALPSTLALAALALGLALAVGTVIAVAATLTRRPWLRDTLAALPGLGVALPTFWVGLMLLQVFSFRLPLFPAVGTGTPAAIVLPAVTLAIPLSAIIAQVLFRALQNAWIEPFVTTFHASGYTRLRLLLRQALPVALLPTLTMGGVLFGQALAGSVVVENVFSRQGLGRLAQTAVTGQDIPLVQGIVLFAAAVFVLVNLVTDLSYPLLDPRLRAARRKVESKDGHTLAEVAVRDDATADASPAGSTAEPASTESESTETEGARA